jgi:hypothetical protein
MAKKQVKKTAVQVQNTVRSETAVKAANSMTPDNLLAALSTLQAKVSTTLGGVAGEITQQLSVLDTLKTAVAAHEARIKDLTGVEATAITQDELEQKIEETRLAWQIEQDRLQQLHEASMAEQELALTLAQNQQMAEAERAKTALALELELTRQNAERAAKIRLEDLTREWALREEALRAQEAEVEKLRKLSENREADITSAVNAAVVKEAASRNAAHSFEVRELKSSAAAAAAMAAEQLRSMTERYEGAQRTIAELQAQVANLNTSLTNMAKEAIGAAQARQQADAIASTAASVASSGGKR